ncbi:MAG: metallophosphoesterase [Clostridia bacterium]|nr:metallophosphoesterase [Clostridia bacterium]
MKLLYKLLAFILALFIYSPVNEIATYTTSKEDADLVFSVLSDVHVEGNNKDKFELLGEGLRDVNSADKNDALIFLGDNTMNGQVIELSSFFGLLKKHNQIDNVFMVTGNHDLCPSKYNVGDYEDLKDRFFDYKGSFIKAKYDTLYYNYSIDGYKFIVLGSESDAGVQEDLSDEQLDWLENELKLAEKDGKPIFIFNHYPLNHTWEDVWTDGHIGEDSEKLHEILKNSKNQIIYFSGHLHMGLYDNQVSYVNEDNITYISVPAFGADNTIGDADIQDKGMGMYVEVYENEIVVRVRNFAEHKWMGIEHSISL